MKAWLLGGLAAVALLVAARTAAAVNPFRPAVFNEAKATQGFWKTLETDEHGDFQPWGLMLTADGRFTQETTNANGDVDQKQGRYTYERGYLVLTRDGESEPFAVIRVEVGDDTLDLHVGAKQSHWVRDGVLKIQ
jgi:hypothetical protein